MELDDIFKINQKTGRIELLPLSPTEWGYINDILIKEIKKQELGGDEIFYKMKSLEAGIRYKLQHLIALDKVLKLPKKKRNYEDNKN